MEYSGTIVTIEERNVLFPSTNLYCTTNKGVNFYLISYNNGILKIEPKVNANLKEFALMVSKLFDPSSNFYGIKRVKFEFNGIPISVSAKKATPFLIVKQYHDKWEKYKKTFLDNEKSITMGTWKSIDNPPKKDGRYMVKFKFYNRHETEQIEIAYRKFKNGNWFMPYYNKPNEDSKLIAWLDEEE